jgi:hypothetical protein
LLFLESSSAAARPYSVALSLFGRLSRSQRIGMNFNEWEMAINESYGVTQLINFFELPIGLSKLLHCKD